MLASARVVRGGRVRVLRVIFLFLTVTLCGLIYSRRSGKFSRTTEIWKTSSSSRISRSQDRIKNVWRDSAASEADSDLAGHSFYDYTGIITDAELRELEGIDEIIDNADKKHKSKKHGNLHAPDNGLLLDAAMDTKKTGKAGRHGADVAELKLQSQPAFDYTGDVCSSAPDSSNIFIVMKTGASEVLTKLPAHLLTLWNCVHKDQYMIFSDHEDTYAGHTIHDALKGVSDRWKDELEEFEQYRQLKEGREARLNLGKLSGGASWNLDKWKFLPLTFSAFEAAPAHIEWFFFIEADTSVAWVNLLLWLKTLDPKKELYLGAIRIVGNLLFAHGGSGYVMSRPAIEKLAKFREKEGREKYDERWQEITAREGFGDAIIAEALKEVDIPVTDADPYVQSENLKSIQINKDKLCRPIVSLHHVAGELVSDLWRLQTEWVKEHGWGKPYLRREVFNKFIAGLITEDRYGWNNLADSQHFIADKEATEDEKKASNYVPWEKMNPEEKAATEDEVSCANACDLVKECISWRWKPGRCYMAEEIKLGQRDVQPGDEDWISGWHEERVGKLKEEIKRCQWPEVKE
ncbi:Hypothetical protein D9617_17g046650 [Elsinoe fawcettii]|nr:Hypothetical protein D9617_17g046650 [Elsinoe fawcettii]